MYMHMALSFSIPALSLEAIRLSYYLHTDIIECTVISCRILTQRVMADLQLKGTL
jgi:hypothetical protein